MEQGQSILKMKFASNTIGQKQLHKRTVCTWIKPSNFSELNYINNAKYIYKELEYWNLVQCSYTASHSSAPHVWLQPTV